MIRFTLNGIQIEVPDGESRTLLEFLRNVRYRTYLRIICRIHLVAMRFEDAGSVIHRTANQACERQNRCMIYFVASE